MSASRRAPALAATVAGLGIAAATVIILTYSFRTFSRKKTRSYDVLSALAEEEVGGGAMVMATEDKQKSTPGDEQKEVTTVRPLALAHAQPGSKALVICADGSEEATTAAAWALASRGCGATVDLAPSGSLEAHDKSSSGSYDFVVVERGAAADSAVLGQVLKLLKAGGKANVAFDDEASACQAPSKRALTFAGFVEVDNSPEDGRVLFGQRPSWEQGAAAPLRLSLGKAYPNGSGGTTANGSSNGNGAPTRTTWTLSADDDMDEPEDNDLVDEDALLAAAAPVKRPSTVDANGCETKRRACKDCSCGRAEKELQEGANGVPRPLVSIDDVDDALTSACGNCSRGDAFRCGGCPFLGKPAFEKGQEKLIMLSDLDTQQDE